MRAKVANINHRAVPFYAALLSTCAGTIFTIVFHDTFGTFKIKYIASVNYYRTNTS